MSKKLTFQEIILTLQQYWNDQGCMLMQAYDNEKGAGTEKTQIVSTNTTNSK